MRQVLVFMSLLGLPLSAGAVDGPQWSMGVGMEGRFQHEVNPDFADPHYVPMLYTKLLMWPYALLVEVGRQSRNSSSGSLAVSNVSTNVDLWGHYEFMQPGVWSPFVSTGTGVFFDRVNTAFESSTDSRSGTRMMLGIGGGVTSTFWKTLLVELEGRAEAVQESKEAHFSGLIRLGWTI